MKTEVIGDHVYHTEVPDGAQANDHFAHRLDWAENCTLCTKFTRADVLARGDGLCHLCEKPVDPDNWHADHIVPVVMGGPDILANLLPSHPFCNQSKGAGPDYVRPPVVVADYPRECRNGHTVAGTQDEHMGDHRQCWRCRRATQTEADDRYRSNRRLLANARDGETLEALVAGIERTVYG